VLDSTGDAEKVGISCYSLVLFLTCLSSISSFVCDSVSFSSLRDCLVCTVYTVSSRIFEAMSKRGNKLNSALNRRVRFSISLVIYCNIKALMRWEWKERHKCLISMLITVIHSPVDSFLVSTSILDLDSFLFYFNVCRSFSKEISFHLSLTKVLDSKSFSLHCEIEFGDTFPCYSWQRPSAQDCSTWKAEEFL
jgi:hypothetical protein